MRSHKGTRKRYAWHCDDRHQVHETGGSLGRASHRASSRWFARLPVALAVASTATRSRQFIVFAAELSSEAIYCPCFRASSISSASRLLQCGARVRAREIAVVSASARPDDFAADVAAGGCGYASAVNHVHARAASFPDLRDHVVRLMNRGE